MSDTPAAPIDLRLAIGAVTAWIGVAVLDGPSVRRVLAAVVAAGCLGALALVASARGRRGAASVALAAWCLALVLTPLAGRIAMFHASSMYELATQRAPVSGELTVRADPRRIGVSGISGSPRVVVAGSMRGASMIVFAPAAHWEQLVPGQHVRVDGRLAVLDERSRAVGLTVHDAPTLIGRPPWWQRMAARIRASLREASAGLPDGARGLLPGLVVGDTAGLDPVLADHVRNAGLTHLVAVSGTNCSIVIGAVVLVLTRARARPWLCASGGVLALVMFVVIARPASSVLRAAAMALIALVALATGRPRGALPALSAAVLVLLVSDPGLARDAGFTMSVLATAALVLIAPSWASALRSRHVPPVLAESIAVAAAAHLVTAPVVAALHGTISVVAIPANVLAEPVVAVATIAGFLAAAVAPLWLPAGTLFAELAGWPCRWIVLVANRLGGLDGAVIAWPAGLVGALALVLVIAIAAWLSRWTTPRRSLLAGLVIAATVTVPVRQALSGWPPAHAFFVMCDVGQGDGLILPLDGHSAIVIDAGPEPVAIDRCLTDLGIQRVPLLVITHFHLDHVGGIDGVLRHRRVDEVIVSPLAEPISGVRIAMTAVAPRGLALTPARPGVRMIGDVALDVLGPTEVERGTRSDPNNDSVVIRADVQGVRILLAADAEVEEQHALLASGADLRADVLKVPHHGSAYSDPAFLAAAHATVALISVGADNDYGHPAPSLLAELTKLGVLIQRTDRDGDLAVTAQGGRIGTVVRGKRGVALGARHPRLSATDARMSSCLHRRPDSSPTASRRSSPSSVMTSSWCTGRSRLSPRPRAPPSRRSSRPSWPVAIWRGPSCTNCSARPCSATRAC